MKKLLIFSISIIMLFVFFGCDSTDKRTNKEKYDAVIEMINTAATELKTEAAGKTDSYALQLIMDMDGSFSFDETITGKASADLKAQVKFDFTDISKSLALVEGSAKYPLSLGSKTAGIYYNEGNLYRNLDGNKFKGPCDLTSFQQTAGVNYINDLIEVLQGGISDEFGKYFDMVEALKDLSLEQQIYALIRIEAGENPFIDILIDNIAEAADNIKIWDLYNFTVSDKQVKVSLNYPVIKAILIAALDGINSDLSPFTDVSKLSENEAINNYLKKESFGDIIYYNDYSDFITMIQDLYPDLTSAEFEGLIASIEENYTPLTPDTYANAAYFLSNHREDFVDYTYENINIDAFIQKYQSNFDENYASNAEHDLEIINQVIDYIPVIKQCLPSVLEFALTIDFDGKFIKNVDLQFNLKMNLPNILVKSIINKEEDKSEGPVSPEDFQDISELSASLSFKAAIERDASKITFAFPEDLSSYPEGK